MYMAIIYFFLIGFRSLFAILLYGLLLLLQLLLPFEKGDLLTPVSDQGTDVVLQLLYGGSIV